AETVHSKLTLLSRPVDMMMANAHAAMGWLVRYHRRAFIIENGQVKWQRNPLRVLAEMYHFLHLEDRDNAAPVQQIWPDDLTLLNRGLQFYEDLERNLGIDTEKDYLLSHSTTGENTSHLYEKLNSALLSEQNPFQGQQPFNRMDDRTYRACQAAHRGWQSGMTMLDLFILMGERAGVLDFEVDDTLAPRIPDRFRDKENQADYLKALAPPPVASADTIVAVSGGMFYSRETPDSEPYVDVGGHFDVGQPLYIIEVMKMFNKVYAEFSGTVEEILIDGDAGKVVKKGQPLFRVKPDEEIIIETEEEKAARRKKATLELLRSVAV
ncbi:MAG: biotin carboxylase, partial [Leptospiraceae bacterium]|nr:biotin carboxylase [Leptospiraceae bacterium]